MYIFKTITYLMVYISVREHFIYARKRPNILFVLKPDIDIQIESNLIVLSYICI